MRSLLARTARITRSPWVLLLGVMLLGASALLGNVFQNADRSSLRQDNRELKAGNAELQAQLDQVKGEQECRSQIASEAEVITGQLLAGIGKLLVAIDERNHSDRDDALVAIGQATLALEPALKARQEAVDFCAGREPAPSPTSTTTTVPSVDPTAPQTIRRRVSSTTQTSPLSTTTITAASTTTPTSACVDVLGFICI